MTNEVDARMQLVQAAASNSLLDCSAAPPDLQQLASCHYTVLSRGERCE